MHLLDMLLLTRKAAARGEPMPGFGPRLPPPVLQELNKAYDESRNMHASQRKKP